MNNKIEGIRRLYIVAFAIFVATMFYAELMNLNFLSYNLVRSGIYSVNKVLLLILIYFVIFKNKETKRMNLCIKIYFIFQIVLFISYFINLTLNSSSNGLGGVYLLYVLAIFNILLFCLIIFKNIDKTENKKIFSIFFFAITFLILYTQLMEGLLQFPLGLLNETPITSIGNRNYTPFLALFMTFTYVQSSFLYSSTTFIFLNKKIGLILLSIAIGLTIFVEIVKLFVFFSFSVHTLSSLITILAYVLWLVVVILYMRKSKVKVSID